MMCSSHSKTVRLAPHSGLPKELAKDQNLLRMVLPAIKADHLAMDKYVFNPDAEKVEVPILAMGGDEDPRCPAEQVGRDAGSGGI
jgi:surfactin synthase thioesterase subunit